MAGAIQETCSSEMFGGQGAEFPKRGCALEHLNSHDKCSTSYDPASLLRGRRNISDRWNGKIARCIGARPSALHSAFHF